MAKYYYNDVLLPEIPADVLTTYPYAFIRNNTTSGYYDLLLAEGVFFMHANGTLNTYWPPVQWYKIEIATADSATEWAFSSSGGSASFSIDSARPVMWSNFDIPNGSQDATEIYFYGSEPAPETPAHTHSYTETVTTAATCTTAGVKTYTCACGDSYTEEIPATGHSYVNGVCTVCGAADPDYDGSGTTDPEPDDGETVENYQIERDTLEGLGDQVRRLCNVEGVLQPPKMTELLEGLNIDLEEAYVTATTEEQTITPSEGYYGFSKIVVEAVEEDDGSGGGGTGGETSYPDADSGSFGNVIDPVETYTGRYIYNGKSLPAIPDEAAEFPYRIIYYSIENDLYYLHCSKAPYCARTQTLGSILLVGNYTGDGNVRTYRIPYSTAETATDWVWNATGNYSAEVDGPSGYLLLWTNHDIYFYNTGVWTVSDEKYTSGTSASREMKEGVVSLPTTTEEYYVISGNSLNALAAEVQRITGADGLYSVNAMIAALQTV